MKIYYAHSIRGQHQDGERTPLEIINYLKLLGYDVLSEEIRTTSMTLGDQEIYQRDTAMIRECDMVLANVANASLGVGYELGYAEAIGKIIVCFSQESLNSRISAMISGNSSMKLYFVTNLSQLQSIISSS